jgi:hypothetical protein
MSFLPLQDLRDTPEGIDFIPLISEVGEKDISPVG